MHASSTTSYAAAARGPLAPLAGARTVVLTTYRRDGRAVPTAMSIAVDGERVTSRQPIAWLRTN